MVTKSLFEMAHEGETIHSENPCNSGYYFASVIGFGEVMFIETDGKKKPRPNA
jgi:nitroimidazol reductase NimA-like FMN-containing flavoprotein (pyridoxamine 5'-phosphate oxidase superfamily)